jgi:signal transduction histidine kinase
VAEEMAQHVATAMESAQLCDELRRAVQVRDDVMAIVSHDLRNQLGVVALSGNVVALAAERGDMVNVRQRTETIVRVSTEMGRLVGDLLDMALIDSGKLSLERCRLDLAGLLTESRERHLQLAGSKGIDLTSSIVDRPLTIDGDRFRLLQVLANVLGNAIKVCSPGDRIVMRAARQDGHASVSVSDTGPGIPEDQLRSLFEPYRAFARNGRKGTGLGLHIARGIVTAHGGRVWVESEVGRGTTVTFTSPIVDDP